MATHLTSSIQQLEQRSPRVEDEIDTVEGGNDSDSEGDGSEDGESEDDSGSDEDPDESDEDGGDDEDAAALREKLQKVFGDADAGADDEDSSISDEEASMDDEQMMAIDEKLAEVFKSTVNERSRDRGASFSVKRLTLTDLIMQTQVLSEKPRISKIAF